jgi:hypothetical protein
MDGRKPKLFITSLSKKLKKLAKKSPLTTPQAEAMARALKILGDSVSVTAGAGADSYREALSRETLTGDAAR